jgi:multidrug efflux pump subunit AcrA (membrane-fusion protein)
VLDALRQARALREKPEEALAALEAARAQDPTGVVLAIEAATAALLSKKYQAASRWARQAKVDAEGNPELLAKAEQLLAKLGPAGADRPVTPTGPLGKTFEEACHALRDLVGQGRGPIPLEGRGVSDATCNVEKPLDVPAPTLRRAAMLEVTTMEGGELRLAWAAVGTPDGVLAVGPVARSFVPTAYRLSNGYDVTLQQADLVADGAPEIAVQVAETRTQLDVALNEVREVGLLRLVVLTTDRGGLLATPSLTLSRHETVRLAVPDSKGLPAGYEHSADLGKTQEFQMRVAWGPNQITLTRSGGKAKPDQEGTIQLFPGPGPRASAAPAGSQ